MCKCQSPCKCFNPNTRQRSAHGNPTMWGNLEVPNPRMFGNPYVLHNSFNAFGYSEFGALCNKQARMPEGMYMNTVERAVELCSLNVAEFIDKSLSANSPLTLSQLLTTTSTIESLVTAHATVTLAVLKTIFNGCETCLHPYLCAVNFNSPTISQIFEIDKGVAKSTYRDITSLYSLYVVIKRIEGYLAFEEYLNAIPSPQS